MTSEAKVLPWMREAAIESLSACSAYSQASDVRKVDMIAAAIARRAPPSPPARGGTEGIGPDGRRIGRTPIKVKPGQSLGAAIEEARASPPATAEAEALCAEINDIAEAVDASGYGDRALGNRLLEAAARLRALGQPAAAQAWTRVTDDEATLPTGDPTGGDILVECVCGHETTPRVLHRVFPFIEEHGRGYHRGCRWMPWPRQPDAQGGK